jgi:dephospho-CoA kinase
LPTRRSSSSPKAITCCSIAATGRACVPADEVWYVDVDPALRLERLIARHVQFGRSPAEAEAWVMNSDEINAALIETTRSRADRIVRRD